MTKPARPPKQPAEKRRQLYIGREFNPSPGAMLDACVGVLRRMPAAPAESTGDTPDAPKAGSHPPHADHAETEVA